MALLSPDVDYGNTLEASYNTMSFKIGLLATRSNQFGTTAFSGTFGYEPQLSTTAPAGMAYPNFGQMVTITYPAPEALLILTSNAYGLQPMMRSRWLSASITETSATNWNQASPPLTEEELNDIHQGIVEIKSGKSNRFTTLREALEWLNAD